jgi:hypothetical protein
MKNSKPIKKVHFSIFSAFVILILSTRAFATTYYVSTGGNDSNPGTSSSPWKTIQKAANTVAAGDTVIVGAGTYNEPINVSRSGTSDSSRITFSASGTVQINGAVSLSGSYIKFDGFTVTRTGGGSGYSTIEVSGSYTIVQNCKPTNTDSAGIMTTATSTYCQLLSNTITNAGAHGIHLKGMHHTVNGNEVNGVTDIKGGYNYGDSNGMTVFGGYHSISNNYVHGITQTGGAHVDCLQTYEGSAVAGARALNHTTIEKNVFFGYHPDGATGTSWCFMLEGPAANPPSYLYIKNNLFFVNNGINSGPGYPMHDIYICNNTFIGNPEYTPNPAFAPASVALGLKSETNLYIYNNIYTDFGRIYSFSGNTNQNVDYEHAWNQGDAVDWGSVTPIHKLTSNPDFVNFVAGPTGLGDYHLTSSSPGRDAGTTVATVTDDYDGVSRPQGDAYDIGAYEYTTSTSQPLPPTGLHVVL